MQRLDQKHSPSATVPSKVAVGLVPTNPLFEHELSRVQESYISIEKESLNSIENFDHGKPLANMGLLEASNTVLKGKVRRYCQQSRKTFPEDSVLQRWAYRTDDKKPRLFFSDTAKVGSVGTIESPS